MDSLELRRSTAWTVRFIGYPLFFVIVSQIVLALGLVLRPFGAQLAR